MSISFLLNKSKCLRISQFGIPVPVYAKIAYCTSNLPWIDLLYHRKEIFNA